tara:strand:- start:1386 stop:1667 length:282 start_codon:yes stop_codon:yes gene_type:complete
MVKACGFDTFATKHTFSQETHPKRGTNGAIWNVAFSVLSAGQAIVVDLKIFASNQRLKSRKTVAQATLQLKGLCISVYDFCDGHLPSNHQGLY